MIIILLFIEIASKWIKCSVQEAGWTKKVEEQRKERKRSRRKNNDDKTKWLIRKEKNVNISIPSKEKPKAGSLESREGEGNIRKWSALCGELE